MRDEKCIDPDYRREPKTDRFCVRCQRDIYENEKHMLVYVRASGHEAVHPKCVELLADPEDLGWRPIGMDCASIIGLDWCKEPVWSEHVFTKETSALAGNVASDVKVDAEDVAKAIADGTITITRK